MELGAAVELLRFHLGAKAAGSSEDGVQGLVEAVGRNPKMLSVAGGLINMERMDLQVGRGG